MIIENVFVLAAIAALCGMDVTAFGQFMICRPIFCAPLFGYLCGDVSSGLWIGMIAEMLWINAVPLGVAVPIDITSVSILPVFWACKFFSDTQSPAIWGLALAVPFAYLYREIDVLGRNFNIKLMRWVENGISSGKEYRIDVGIFVSLFLFFARIWIFYIMAFIVGGWLFQGIYLQFPAFMISGFKKAWYALPVLGFGAVLYNFKNIKLPFVRK
jgi:PTS system mannose-specific IIC component